jgi:3-polyprenyl-4-hydroxybenzoate decarboxylase
VRDVYFTHGGGGFYHAVVQIDQKMPGWTKQAIMAAFAAFPPLKMVTVVDCDVDIRNPMDVEWAMTERLDAAKDIHVIEDVFGHGLNPTFPGYLGAKVGFDATRPFPYTPDWGRGRRPPSRWLRRPRRHRPATDRTRRLVRHSARTVPKAARKRRRRKSRSAGAVTDCPIFPVSTRASLRPMLRRCWPIGSAVPRTASKGLR